MSNRLIFLDFDGVLTSSKWYDSEEHKLERANVSDIEMMLTFHSSNLDPAAIKLVNDLVDRSGAIVIVSSTWRNRYTINELNDLLQSRGATFIIEDRTPSIVENGRDVARGKEIAAYLNILQNKTDGFVILDDFNNMLHLTNHLVLTKFNDGLTAEDVEKALSILNEDL